MLRTLIIEDEPAVRKEIEWLVQSETNCNFIGAATNVAEALVLIKATNPELVLMDIQLTDGTAFDILNKLTEINFKIIFITAYNDFAVKAIKYGAIDYLLKPLDEYELKLALDRIYKANVGHQQHQAAQLAVINTQLQQQENTLENRLVLHTLEFLQVLQLKEIIYCQSEGSYTTFYLSEERKLIISKPLKYYDELLPEQWFLRPHQSYLVNIKCVDKFLKSGTLILKDKTEIPVSNRRRELIIQQINTNVQ
ncbi:LytR/AlgR family response regulator transcription factor [Pedobacter sp. SL55]|uniref:LytR/AlgR family response regulator transcription factor n=1 Tax=Pedobacter sp. SL55 TaxID=2995161 RepID=UPI002271AD03|nr:LytTR family DNA-binding domain-containing protein [Pedobacter sp. SL55]WAC42604.1 LytTR family DNA-binding domain-containing protein [Pedobacter sp. SL55]